MELVVLMAQTVLLVRPAQILKAAAAVAPTALVVLAELLLPMELRLRQTPVVVVVVVVAPLHPVMAAMVALALC